MVKVRQLFALLLGILATSPAWPLSTMVDRNTIALDETARLEISTHSRENLEDIDLSGIERDFIIAGSSKRHYASMINGRTERQTTLALTLKPRATGKATVPALKLGKETTQPIIITVRSPAPLAQGLADNSVILQAELDKNTALPGEQIIYTFRLLYRAAIANAEITELSIPFADITPLDDNSYQRVINGYNYKVVEKRYALHFNKSGHHQWPAQQLTAELSNGARSRFGFDPFAQGKIIKLSAPVRSVEIEPKPSTQSNGYWLPSSELTISQKWLGDAQSVSVGQPISRKVTIMAKGLLAEKLPSINLPSISGLNTYAEKPVFVNQQWREGIAGQREETQVIIPTAAGDYTLPSIHISWWNTRTQKFENAVLPEQNFTVIASPVSAPLQADTAKPVIKNEAGSNSALTAQQDAISQSASTMEPTPTLWKVASMCILALWLFTLSGWYYHISTLKKLATPNHSDTKSKADIHLKKLYMQLCQACEKNDAAMAKPLLNSWLAQQQLFSAENPPEMLQWAIDSLNAALYANHNEALQWDGNQLLNALQSIKAQPPAVESALAPLYPV